MNQRDQLIKILLDENGLFADRHDAAMDLGAFADPKVVEALSAVASPDQKVDDIDKQIIIEACGESLAAIWISQDAFDVEAYQHLHPIAQRELKASIRAQKPDWLPGLKSVFLESE